MLMGPYNGARGKRASAPRHVALSFLAGLVLIAASPAVTAQINFQNVTPSALEGFVTESWGGAWGDYNGDFWPDMVIPNHRERPSVYRNNGDGTFTNVVLQADTSKTWISNRTADHHGVALADFDGDGDDDVFTITNGCCPSQLQVSYGETFVDETTSRGLPGVAGSSTQWMDVNRDGMLDIVNGDRIYLQDASNNFPTSMFIGGCGRTYWALLTDINNDGVQDFVCTNEGNFPKRVFDISGTTPVDITSEFPVVGNVVDSAARDFDNDGDVDHVFVRGTTIVNQVKLITPTRLEANLDTSANQVGTAGSQTGFRFAGGGVVTLKLNKASWFTNVDVFVGSSGTGIPFPAEITLTLDPNDPNTHGMPASTTGREIYVGYDPASGEWTVIQGDGPGWWLVYAQVESSTPMTNVVATGLRDVDSPMRARVMMNEASGFVNRTFEKGLSQDIYKCNSVAADDFDNDMDVDLFFACSDGVENISNRVFANNGNGVFTEVTAGGAGGVTGPAISASAGTGEIALTADYDNDGFVDVFVTNGVNTQPVRIGGPHELFRNTGNSNNWISIELAGTASNAAGIGATVRATAGGVTQMREYGGTYHRWSQDYKRAHFGLAGNSAADIEVTWPNGTVENFPSQTANSIYLITEGSGSVQVNPGAVSGFAAAVPGDECGTPSYNNQLDRSVFVYRDCTTGRWSMRATAGGSTSSIVYAGDLGTNQTYSNVTGVSIEGGDVLTSTANTVAFSLQMSGFGFDGFDFDVTPGADNCFDVSLPGISRLLIGPGHIPVTPPIDLTTMTSCTPQVTPSFSVQSLTVDESVGTANVVVSLSPPVTSGSATVNFATTSAGTATPGSDYYGTYQPLTFAAGETSKIATVTIVNDTAVESTETVGVRIFGAGGGASISNANALVSINDDDAGVAVLSISPLTVSEATGSATVTVTMSQAQTSNVTVGFATTTGGTATAGSDYYGKYQLVTFSPGSTSETVPVTLVNDNTPEATETLIVRIFNPSGAVIGANTGVVTISDDD